MNPASPISEKESTMQLSDVTNLVKLLDKSGLAELRFSDGTTNLVLKKPQAQVAAAPAPAYYAAPAQMPAGAGAAAPAAAPAAPAAEAPSKAAPASNLKDITSPMVGTYYAASSPDAPPLAQVGQSVRPGQVVCIIEAMKIMNEIESDVAGEIVEVCVSNETPVEYGTVLYRVRPA
ncbi:MAG: accB [Fibrobacteria bacterium]|jgi:acetyl-CoA carboxylase biotin carboxyl carrier protein|nr:accB [Fibrobacteria bacterium]